MPSLHPHDQCEQCKHTDCFSLHHSDYSLADCPLPSCDVCSSLAEAETEISLTLNHLVELSKRRSSLKRLINERHNRSTFRLPTEVLSEIFAHYCKNFYRGNEGPLIIGEVCRWWRDVTLGTPRLWSTVAMALDAQREQPYDIDVAAEWLSRSRTLPLTLSIKLYADEGIVDPESNMASPIIHLLRSHSSRWQHLAVDSRCNPSLLQPLLYNLENIPLDLESFDISSPEEVLAEVDFDRNRFLLPRTLHATRESTTFGLPCGWERLTSLSAIKSLYLNEIVRIIRNAPNLAECSIRVGTLGVTEAFDIPDDTVISHSLTFLRYQESLPEADEYLENLLSFLTLPSLETLHYTYRCHSRDNLDFDVVESFLIRSSPPLQNFSFCITPLESYSVIDIRYTQIPSITSLEFDTTELDVTDFRHQVKQTDDFLSQLSRALKDEQLPKLQQLVLHVPTPPKFWAVLCNLFPRPSLPQTDQTQHSNVPQTSGETPSVSGVLSSIHIYPRQRWTRGSFSDKLKVPKVSMGDAVFSRLVEIESSGVELVLRRRGDFGGPGTWTYPLSAALNTPPQS